MNRFKISESQKELWKDMRVINSKRVGYFLTLTNQDNPYYDKDLERIFSTRSPIELESIFNEIDDLSSSMSTLSDNHYLLYDGDYQILENENWQYYERMDGTIQQQCLNINTNEITFGTDAFSQCTENIN